jgi:hypothetical protein
VHLKTLEENDSVVSIDCVQQGDSKAADKTKAE